MKLKKGNSRQIIAENVGDLIRSGKSRKSAIQTAMAKAHESGAQLRSAPKKKKG